MDRPEWMEWDLVFVPHVEERMKERGFTEIDVRTILEEATAASPSRREGRWMVPGQLQRRTWVVVVVVVEPEPAERLTYVVTAYPRG